MDRCIISTRVAYTLHDYLDIRREEAVRQWRAIQARQERVDGKRQEKFRPVEVLLCFALFRMVDPRRFGGTGVRRLPEPVLRLARTVRRSPGSLLFKMQNLNLDMAHSAKVEPELFLRLSCAPDHFLRLYCIVIGAAREAGLDPSAVPDFLGFDGTADASLLGQDELGDREIAIAMDGVRNAVETERMREMLGERDTERLVEQKIRVGQHRFAAAVLAAYANRCGFCGWSPEGLRSRGLLLASHIKPWKDCASDHERLDPRNGIAACPMHDKAFDGGLLTVNGGLRIHRARDLEARLGDPPTGAFFGAGVLRPSLLVGQDSEGPDKAYLDYHRKHVFERVG